MAENNKQINPNDIYNEDSLGTKFINGVKSNIAFIITVLISVAFIFTGLIKIDFQEGDIVSIICNSILGIIVGWLIKSLLGKQGLMNGLKNSKVIEVQEKYNNICERNNAKSEYYPAYCEIKNEQKVKNYQTTILTGVNLKYTAFIHGEYDNIGPYKNVNEQKTDNLTKEQLKALKKEAKALRNGYYTNVKGKKIGFTKKQLKALKKARNPHIVSITPEYLVNEITYDSIRERKEETTHGFELRRNVTTFIGAGVVGVVLGYFSVSLIQNPSIANIIWTSLQMLIYIAIGFTEFIRRYLWVLNEHVSYIKKRIAYHIEFENMISEHNILLYSKIEQYENEARLELEQERKEEEVQQDD